ncbi:MAG: alkaline phosphatase family protein, partial [Myxococcota bacterium]
EAHPVGGYLGTWVAEPRVPEALPDAQARERVDRYAQRDAVFPYAADASQPERIWVHPGAGALVVDVALDVLAQRSAETGGPGLLALSFSHTDKIGHAWTSTSREYADAVLRLGDELDRLFDALDARGLRWGAVLTGDHGGLGAPEGYLRFHADDAGAHPTDGPLASPDAFLEHRRAAQGYLSDPAVVATEAWRACGGATGAARWSFPYVWFPEGSAEVRACAKAGAARALGALRDGDVSLVAAVVDTDAGEVLTGALTADVRAAVAASTFQGRSGDLHVVLAPGVVHLDRREAPVDAGTDHGMPWDYDRNVPLLFLGDARVRAEALEAPVDLRRVAPTLGGWLGIRRPLADDVAPPLPR